MRMESFWRWLGVALGKYWKVVAAVVTLITVVFAIGARNIEFATGQDSYLNPDSQIAIDNVAFQDDFGGETVILLFSSTDGSDISELYEGENLAELERITASLEEVDGALRGRHAAGVARVQFESARRGRRHRRVAVGGIARRSRRRGAQRRRADRARPAQRHSGR